MVILIRLMTLSPTHCKRWVFIYKTNNHISNLNFTFVDGVGIFGLVLKGEMLGFDRKEKVCTNNQMAIN